MPIDLIWFKHILFTIQQQLIKQLCKTFLHDEISDKMMKYTFMKLQIVYVTLSVVLYNRDANEQSTLAEKCKFHEISISVIRVECFNDKLLNRLYF